MHFTWCTTFSKNLNKNIVWKDLHVWLRLWMVPRGLLFWLFLYSSCFTKGYYRKKQGVWLGTNFFGKTPEICRYVTLPLEIQDKTRLHSWDFCKIVLATPLKHSRTKYQDHWKFFFLLTTSGYSTSFLTNLWKSCILFLRYAFQNFTLIKYNGSNIDHAHGNIRILLNRGFH